MKVIAMTKRCESGGGFFGASGTAGKQWQQPGEGTALRRIFHCMRGIANFLQTFLRGGLHGRNVCRYLCPAFERK